MGIWVLHVGRVFSLIHFCYQYVMLSEHTSDVGEEDVDYPEEHGHDHDFVEKDVGGLMMILIIFGLRNI